MKTTLPRRYQLRSSFHLVTERVQLAVLVLLLGCLAHAQSPGDLDTSFNGTGADWRVFALARQLDGKLLVGGQFATFNGVPRNRITRLNEDGSTDLTFAPGSGADSTINALALTPEGKLVIGGDFLTFNGSIRRRLARLNADGSLDTTLAVNTDVTATVQSLAVQPDGKVLIAGSFSAVNGTARPRVARLNTDGSLDPAFDPGTGPNGSVQSLALQPDGKVVIGGFFTAVNGATRHRVARLNSNGAVDTSFVPGTPDNGYVNSVSLTADGKVLLAGNIYLGAQSRLVRLLANGTVDATFSNAIDSDVTSAIAQSDGKVLIGGYFSMVNKVSRNGVARLLANGTLDPAFNPGVGANQIVWTLLLQPDGLVVAGGAFTTYAGASRNRITRIYNDGASANQAPRMASISSLTLLEDAGLQNVTVTGISPGPGEAAQTVTSVTATSSDPTVIPHPSVTYTPGAATATLAFTPVANANGVVTISVVAQDNGGTAYGGVDTSTATFTVTVTPVNDAPSFTLNLGATLLGWGRNDYGQTVAPSEAQGGIIAFDAGGTLTLVLKQNGQVVAWGDNTFGQADVPLAAQSGVTAISTHGHHNLALKANGSVVAWGNNSDGQTTVPPEATSEVTAVAAGLYHSVALKANGSVVAWGRNEYGQTSVPPEAASGVIAIAAGWDHTLALKDNGSVVAWGNTTVANVPVEAQSGVIAVASGMFHALALKANGSVVAWGNNTKGQTTVPVAAQSGVIAIAGGGYHSLALKDNGAVVAWGQNTHGATTVPPEAGSGVVAIAAGGDHSLALVGANNLTVAEDAGAQTIPVGIANISPGPANESLQGVSFIVANNNPALFSSPPAFNLGGTLTYTPALNANGSATVTVYAQDTGGTLNGGDDTSDAQTFTITVTPVNDAPTLAAIGVSGTEDTTLAFTAANFTGAYSDVEATPLASLTVATLPATGILKLSGVDVTASQVILAADLVNLTYVPAVNENGAKTFTVTASDGSLSSAAATVTMTLTPVNDAPSFTLVGPGGPVLAWGFNDDGQSSVPGGLSEVTAIGGGGRHSLVLKSDGSVVAWGLNVYGQASVPVAAQSGVTAIAAGQAHSLALKSDGSVVAWGDNQWGQTSVPVGLSGVTAIATAHSGYHSLALKSDGTVVDWGIDGDGNLVTVPAGLSGVTAIAAGTYHSLALKSDGSVVAWGNNDYGQTSVSAAAQSGVTAIAAGGNHSLALKSDGSVVAWGYNGHGQASVPVAAQSGVTVIDAGDNHSLALKSDGSVVAWGYNVQGQTAVPVGLNGVTAIAAGAYHNLVLVNGGLNLTVITINEDVGLQTLGLQAISMGTGDSGQTLTVTASSSNPGLIPTPSVTYTSPSASGSLSFTPVANANGTATITVTLTDDGGTDNGGVNIFSRTFTVVVNPVNDAPALATIGVSGTEDTTLAFTAGNFTGAYSDVEGTPLASITVVTLPATGTLKLSGVDVTPGQVIPAASLGNLTYVPAANENGAKTFTVSASDGSLSSAAATVTMTLAPVNDAPGLVLQPRPPAVAFFNDPTFVWTSELAAGGALLTNLGATVVPFTDFASVVGAYPVIVVPSMHTELVPALDAAARASISNFVHTGGVLVVMGNSVPRVMFPDLINAVFGYSLIPYRLLSPSVKAASAAGTPFADDPPWIWANDQESYAFSSLPPNARVIYQRDGVGWEESSVTVFTVGAGRAVTLGGQFNQTFIWSGEGTWLPVLASAITPVQLASVVNEDAGPQTIGGFASPTWAGPTNESSQVVSFTVTNDNNALFLVQPFIDSSSSGTPGALHYTPKANSNGTAIVTVIAVDNGGAPGVSNSAPQTFTITVTPVNDAPSFNLNGTNLSAFPDDGAVSQANWATNIFVGPGDESGQALAFTVTNGNNALFTVQPALSPGGTLTFTPVPGASGVVTVGVRAIDNGGTANGGADTSEWQTFTITFATVKVFVSDSPVVISGTTVEVPISLAGVGTEGGVSFTLTYDRPRLVFMSVAVEPGSGLTLTWTEPWPDMNKVGIIVTKPTGTTFPAGVNVMLRMTFQAPIGTAPTTTPLGFSSAVVLQQVSDATANVIPNVLYVPGSVTIIAVPPLEGDIAPRNAGGNGSVTVSDAVQITRFVAGWDTITDFTADGEFQRADCAPRGSLGDGRVTLIDLVQTLRYAAGLDPATPAGGPTMQAASLAASSAQVPAGSRVVRVVGGNLIAGRANNVSVQLDAQGNEAGVSLSLGFDPTAMTFVSATVGSGASGGSLVVNNAKAAAGRVGLVLVMPAGSGIAVGTRDIITLTFNVTATSSTAISVSGDSPVAREVADVSANVLGASFVGGSFNIILPAGLKAAGMERAADGSLRLVVVNGDGSPMTTVQAARYEVHVTSDLGGAWTLLPNALVVENGALKIVDPSARSAGLRLYKLVETP